MTATTDLPTFEELHAISSRLGAVLGEIEHLVNAVERFLRDCKDDEGNVVTLPTLEQLGALHSFRELIEMDINEITKNLGELSEHVLDVNLTRLEAAARAKAS